MFTTMCQHVITMDYISNDINYAIEKAITVMFFLSYKSIINKDIVKWLQHIELLSAITVTT